MRIEATAFLLGVCLVQTAATLDGRLAAGGLLLVAAGGLRFAFAGRRAGEGRGRRIARVALAALFALGAGVAWAAWRAELRLASALDGRLEGVELDIRGRVASLPQQGERGWRFVFEIEPDIPGVPQRVQLSWRGDGPDPHAALPDVRAGERWAFTVRLWRPQGSANPAGFDYEAWLLERGVRATGSVRDTARLLDDRPAGLMQHVHRLRGEIRARMLAALPAGEQRGLLVALAVGEQQDIAAADWEIFRRTGVGHLVSISGLHVALVAMFCGGLAGLTWRR
ncbi:MAG: ComEC/Rec2 family competence protein, partial [Thauera sp.]